MSYRQGLGRVRVGYLRERMESIVTLAVTYSRGEIDAAMAKSLESVAYGYGG